VPDNLTSCADGLEVLAASTSLSSKALYRDCFFFFFFLIIKMFSCDEVTEFLFFKFLLLLYFTLYHVYVNVYNSVYSDCGLQEFDSDFIVNLGPKILTLLTEAAFFTGSMQL